MMLVILAGATLVGLVFTIHLIWWLTSLTDEVELVDPAQERRDENAD
jgi:hypothetical protein